MLFISLNPENIDNWSHDIIRTYVSKFQKICKEFKVDVPFEYDEFVNLVFDDGVFFVFMILLSAYEEIVCTKPNFKKRFMWQLKKCLEVLSQISQIKLQVLKTCFEKHES